MSVITLGPTRRGLFDHAPGSRPPVTTTVARMTAEVDENDPETNLYCRESDLSRLDEIAEQMFGTDRVPYRSTINELIRRVEADDTGGPD